MISDRFLDSSIAYQGGAGGLGIAAVAATGGVVTINPAIMVLVGAGTREAAFAGASPLAAGRGRAVAPSRVRPSSSSP